MSLLVDKQDSRAMRGKRYLVGLPAVAVLAGIATAGSGGVVAAADAFLSCGPGTQSVTYSDEMDNFRDTTWSTPETLDLTQFNPAGGRVLTKVEVQRLVTVKTRLRFENTSASEAQTFLFGWAKATAEMSIPGVPALAPVSVEYRVENLPISTLQTIYKPGPDATQFFNDSEDKTEVFTDAGTLGTFTGGGTVTLTGRATGTSASETVTSGNTGFTQYTSAKISASVKYSYVCSDLQLTKTVTGEPAPTDWGFDFTISPAPQDGTPATLRATKANPTVKFTGLVAGTPYTVTEAAVPGFTPEGVKCNGEPTPVTAIGGQTVSCTANNVVIPPPPPSPSPTPPPTPTPTPTQNTPTPTPTPTTPIIPTVSPTCGVIGSEGEDACTVVPLTVSAKGATSKVKRGSYQVLVKSAKTDKALATLGAYVECYEADGDPVKCSYKVTKSSGKVQVKITKCKIKSVSATVTATPKTAYRYQYMLKQWSRTWKVKAC